MNTQEIITKTLGRKVEDKATGHLGIVTSVSFDLYGCVQVLVSPQAKNGELNVSLWFDIERLAVKDSESIMPIPSFVAKGLANKPIK